MHNRSKTMSMLGIAVLVVLGACGTDDATDDTATDTAASSSGGDGEVTTDATAATDAGSGAADAGSSSGAADAGAVDAGAAAADAGGGTVGGGDVGAKVDFYGLNVEGKQDFMKKHVLPAMTKILQTADAKKYAKVGCTTCHGLNALTNEWKMPAEDGPKPLDPKALPPIGKWPLVDAMYKHVVPEIGAIIGAAPFDPKTGKGFGCFSCHTVKK